MARPRLDVVSPVLKPLGYEGGRANMNDIETQDRVNDQATKIQFGRAVARSASDKTCKLATLVTDKLLGFAVRHSAHDVIDADNEWAYHQNDSVTIAKRGWYFAIPFDNVTEGDPVVVVAGQAGKFGSANAAVADTAVAAAGEANTGDGTLTMDVVTPILSDAISGEYTAVCVAAVGNPTPLVSTWEVRDPHGFLLGTVDAGQPFANQIAFQIADGAADFVVGDTFTVTVTLNVGRVLFGSSTWETTTLAGEIGIMRVDMTPR